MRRGAAYTRRAEGGFIRDRAPTDGFAWDAGEACGFIPLKDVQTATVALARDPQRGSANAGGGLGLFGALFLVLLVLKLLGKIAMSWWWVTAPLWGGFALVLVIYGVFVLFCLSMALLTGQLGRGRRR